MTNHTPTPWQYAGTGTVMHGYMQPFGIAAITQEVKSLICGCFSDIPGGVKTAEANAAHIVKCVNLHDELVAACRDLVVCVECADYSPTHEEYVRQAKSLLAKAEGASNEPT